MDRIQRPHHTCLQAAWLLKSSGRDYHASSWTRQKSRVDPILPANFCQVRTHNIFMYPSEQKHVSIKWTPALWIRFTPDLVGR